MGLGSPDAASFRELRHSLLLDQKAEQRLKNESVLLASRGKSVIQARASLPCLLLRLHSYNRICCGASVTDIFESHELCVAAPDESGFC